MSNLDKEAKALLELTYAARDVLNARGTPEREITHTYYYEKYKYASILLDVLFSIVEDELTYKIPADMALAFLKREHIENPDKIWNVFLDHFYDIGGRRTRPPTPDFEGEQKEEEDEVRYGSTYRGFNR